ncbi:sphingosine-1-phosphate phosphatase 1 [Gadus chalcogrammus]|uniref:sphingosine-1-phosphate phosphatase 1 n=1 Tax=Gadus chalcogrammus TaxID=1042646 RepID=UPI0024C361DF|nr:sphingosine-1-phosphate phosphatase 1 [Gadus chalcogrammus]
MTKRSWIRELWLDLQDPHHVAHFQEMCGVHGSFSRSPGAGGGGELDQTRTHNNGSISGGSETKGSVVSEGGEGQKLTSQTRRRIGASTTTSTTTTTTTTEGETENPSTNGTVLTNATGEGVATGGVKPHSLAGNSPGSTVKPLRKNSLTGDAGHEFRIENRLLYYLFTLGTELGNESFYITFYPFLMWNLDAFVGRRVVMVWVWVMFLGQCTKDLVGWQRPASPPVVKVEMFYNSEYSMPSTHAMSGTALPFSLFFLTYGRWEYPFPIGLGLALMWTVLVCVSRIYMGMHSILDVVVGFLYTVLILLVFLPALDAVDGFYLTYRYAPLVIVLVHLGAGLFSFTLDTWSTSRGDTAQILGTGAGMALASHVNHLLGLLPDPGPEQLPLPVTPLSAGLLALMGVRLALGVLVLLATRAVMKKVTITLVCRLMGVSSEDVRAARQNMGVELPYRYIVYGAVGFNVVFLVPLLFSYTRLS